MCSSRLYTHCLCHAVILQCTKILYNVSPIQVSSGTYPLHSNDSTTLVQTSIVSRRTLTWISCTLSRYIHSLLRPGRSWENYTGEVGRRVMYAATMPAVPREDQRVKLIIRRAQLSRESTLIIKLMDCLT